MTTPTPFRILPVFLWLAAGAAQAQGTPPFTISNPGSASQFVHMEVSAESDDGTHQVEIYPGPGGFEQSRSQSGTFARHGHLSMIPGVVDFVIFPSGGGSSTSAPLPNDFGFRSFLIFEDPVTLPSANSPFLFAGEVFFDAQCGTFTCGYLDGSLGKDGPIESDGESSFNFVAGQIAAEVSASTPDYGRRYYDAAPGGGPTHEHVVDATATAQIQDWVFVTGAGATATLVVSASIAASLDVPPVPVTDEDWTTPVYGDIREFNPCADAVTTSDELLDPSGLLSNEVQVSLAIDSGYQQVGQNWVPSIQGGQSLEVERSSDLHWADEEGYPDCSDDFAEVTAGAVGTLAPSLTLQVVVPTNQWSRVSASATASASCFGPFRCDLDAAAPATISITSPNATLVAWQGIAGLTPVPEPTGSVAAGLGMLGLLARMRGRRRQDAA